MSSSVTAESPIAEALARSAVYRFLSLAFLPPGDSLEPLREECAAALRALASGPDREAARGAAAEAASRQLETASGQALRGEYYRIFGHQISRDCPLYETQYEAREIFQQTQQLADIAGFYLAFGLEMADGVHERPDHLALELEFLQLLCFREAYARTHHSPAEVAILRDAQHLFLRDHLCRWVPVLARLIGRKGESLYLDLARLAAATVAADASAFGLLVEEAVYEPPSSVEPEAASLPCGAATCPIQPGI